MPIVSPAQDCGDEAVKTEIWRIAGVSIGSSDEEIIDSSSSSVDSKLARNPNYNLSLKCRWVSRVGSTVGVRPVRRVVKQLSTLNRWKKYRDAKSRPKTDLEKCIVLFNTVDLEVNETVN